MAEFLFEKFCKIALDGNLSLLSDSALDNAAREISERQSSAPGDFPAVERNPETLASLEKAIDQERSTRSDASS